MARKERTTKQLAQGIDLDYLKKPHPFRRWRLFLSVGAPAVALLWILGMAVAGRQQIYSNGRMTTAHAVFGAQCDVCHTQTLGFFRKHVNDKACLECHDGPTHQDNQTFTPACGSCHLEHQGEVRLAAVADASCTQCHADLKAASGEPRFARVIHGWLTDHPEFAAVRKNEDPGAIKLNHQVHMKAGLRGPKGPVQMECSDCHRASTAAGAWPYQSAELVSAVKQPPPMPPHETTAPSRRSSRYMAPPTYAATCAACHSLRFDARLPEHVPHAAPEVVVAFVRQRYAEFIAKNPAEMSRHPVREGRLPDSPPSPAPPATPAEWIERQLASAETLLWRKTCAECHTLVPQGAGRPPRVTEPNITPLWMHQARFDHETHRLLDCAACHAAGQSQETADLLLPGIATCQQCHFGGNTSAGDSCSLCHTYHDWSRAKPAPGRFSLDKLLRGTSD
ncbi:MAG: multiheme c-type cytochrome [Candidatus Acidiferrales bacterium]